MLLNTRKKKVSNIPFARSLASIPVTLVIHCHCHTHKFLGSNLRDNAVSPAWSPQLLFNCDFRDPDPNHVGTLPREWQLKPPRIHHKSEQCRSCITLALVQFTSTSKSPARILQRWRPRSREEQRPDYDLFGRREGGGESLSAYHAHTQLLMTTLSVCISVSLTVDSVHRLRYLSSV